VVNAHLAEEADVYIEDGVVVAVRPNIPVSANFAAAPLPDWFFKSVDPSERSARATLLRPLVAMILTLA
jgi:hypothetical protein